MSSDLGVVYKTIYDEYNYYDGPVQSRTIIIKKNTPLKPGYMSIPKWKLVLIFLTIIFLTIILISGSLVLLSSKGPAGYLYDCKSRSCFPNLGLKCVEGKCQCENEQFFTKICLNKKTNGAACGNSDQCLSSLECRNGICQCASNEYWDGIKCSKMRSYLESCSKNECSSRNYLYCNTTFGSCICPNSRFWTGYNCVLKRNYNELCYSSSECNESISLKCLDGVCKLLKAFKSILFYTLLKRPMPKWLLF